MRIICALALSAVLSLAAGTQQASPVLLEINGDVAHPLTLQEQDWKALKHVSISASNAHEKKTAVHQGVLLLDLLQAAGVPSGENLRGKSLATCVVVTASDGYKVTFSLAELD